MAPECSASGPTHGELLISINRLHRKAEEILDKTDLFLTRERQRSVQRDLHSGLLAIGVVAVGVLAFCSQCKHVSH